MSLDATNLRRAAAEGYNVEPVNGSGRFVSGRDPGFSPDGLYTFRPYGNGIEHVADGDPKPTRLFMVWDIVPA